MYCKHNIYAHFTNITCWKLMRRASNGSVAWYNRSHQKYSLDFIATTKQCRHARYHQWNEWLSAVLCMQLVMITNCFIYYKATRFKIRNQLCLIWNLLCAVFARSDNHTLKLAVCVPQVSSSWVVELLLIIRYNYWSDQKHNKIRAVTLIMDLSSARSAQTPRFLTGAIQQVHSGLAFVWLLLTHSSKDVGWRCVNNMGIQIGEYHEYTGLD